jgi:hypothetical protein
MYSTYAQRSKINFDLVSQLRTEVLLEVPDGVVRELTLVSPSKSASGVHARRGRGPHQN